MKKAAILVLALCAALALAAGLVACGGSATGDAASATATATSGNGEGGTGGAGDTGGAPASRDTSTLAQALRGHWKTSKDGATGGGAGRENNMYFDGKTCVSVPTGGNTILFNYEVKSEDAATKEIVLTIHRQKADGSAKAEAQDVRITFLNDVFTQYMTAGVTFDYVGPEERP